MFASSLSFVLTAANNVTSALKGLQWSIFVNIGLTFALWPQTQLQINDINNQFKLHALPEND